MAAFALDLSEAAGFLADSVSDLDRLRGSDLRPDKDTPFNEAKPL